MDITHVLIIQHNKGENGVAERYNSTTVNAVWTALLTAKMDWYYWSWALADANNKFNQLPHPGTERSLQELWYNSNIPKLRNLLIFGQIGYVPVMYPKLRKQKQIKRVLLA